MLTITFSAWVYTRETIRKWYLSQICVQLFILTSMRSYPVRLVLVLRCTFVYHHTLCLLIAVALLSMCRFAGSFKHFLCVHVQKAYCKCSTYFWAFSNGPRSACSHLKMSPMSNELFCEVFVLISCVSSIGPNQPAHMCSLARAFTAWTQ